MIDPFVLLAPVLLLGIVALLGFVGCRFKRGVPNVLPPPSNVRAQAGIDAKITLSWDAVTDFGAVSYKIYRSDGAAQDTTTNGNTDTAVMIGTTYSYQVTTIDSHGIESAHSNEVSATPGPITWVQGGVPAERADITNTDNVVTNPFASDVTMGNLIVVWIKYNSNTVQVIAGSGVTDSAGNQYSRAVDQTTGMGSLAGWRQEIWYATIAQSVSNLRVIAKFTGAFNGKKAISPHEYKWANPTEPLELASGKAGVTANPATVASTDALMATDARLVFGAAVIQKMGSSGSGFSQRSSQDGDVAEDMPITSLPSSVSARFLVVSPPGMSQDWIAQVATFK